MEVSLHRLHDTHLRNASLKGAYSSEMIPYARPIRACPMNRSYSRWRGMKPSIASLAFSAVLLTPFAAFAKGEILFIRGADRSGGFMEAKDDSKRTSQLGDINDKASNQRNHGWATFAATLRKAGFKVTQITESLEAGAPQAGQTAGAPVAPHRGPAHRRWSRWPRGSRPGRCPRRRAAWNNSGPSDHGHCWS